MNNEEFIEKSKDMLVEFYNTLINGDYSLNEDNINILSMSSINGNDMVILSTFFDEYLYKVIYIEKTKTFCFDVYHLCSHQEYTE